MSPRPSLAVTSGAQEAAPDVTAGGRAQVVWAADLVPRDPRAAPCVFAHAQTRREGLFSVSATGGHLFLLLGITTSWTAFHGDDY